MLPAIAADTTTSNPDPTAVKAALNSIFSLLLDDDSGTTTTPPSGGTAGGGGGGGTGGTGGTWTSTIAGINIVPPHLGDPDAGTLQGELSVSAAGSATYSIPIVVPPGTAGMQPSLSLDYNGSLQNGLLGVGWSLSGISRITRCAKTIEQDRFNDRVGFTTADRLCLDGQRLLVVNRMKGDDNYWSEGAEYRTEIETFSRITALGAIGARTFKVETKDGRIIYYGGGTASVAVVVQAVQSGVNGKQPDASSKLGAQSWAVARIEDRVGNYVKFEYRQDMARGEHRPSVVRYGGRGTSGPNPPHAAVQFVYDDTRLDKWKRYLDETRIDLVSRLSGIVTYVGDNLDGGISNGAAPAGWNEVRRYNLGYTASQNSGRSLLQSVEGCARGACLPKTVFEWGQPDPSKTPGFESAGIWAGAPQLTTTSADGKRSTNHSDYFAFADFENDGYTDVLEKRKASPKHTDPSPIDQNLEASNSIAAGTMFAEYAYYHNTGKPGTGFTKYAYGLNTSEPFVALDVADFNGDGALDILARTQTATLRCMSPLKQPSALGAPGSKITFACTGSGETTALTDNTTSGLPYMVDVDHDGRASYYTPLVAGKASLCIDGYCQEDTAPPVRVIGNWFADPNVPSLTQRDYVSFSQTADFSGSGKAFDARWTKPFYVQPPAPGTPYWLNAQPRIAMTAFHRPNVSTEQMADYVYPQVPCSKPTASCKYGFDQGYSNNVLTGDFNESGYSSLVFGYQEWDDSLSLTGPTRADFTVCLSTGRSLDCDTRKKYSNLNREQYDYLKPVTVGNFVGDGMPRILVESGLNLKMCRLIGDATASDKSDAAMDCVQWPSSPVLFGLHPLFYGTNAHDEFFFLDLMGTGRTQLVKYAFGSNSWEVFAPKDLASAGQALDRIHRVTNGLGAVSSVQYAELGAVSRTDQSYGYATQRVPFNGKIVNRLVHNNGGAVSRNFTYAYQDPVANTQGRGFLGFRSVIATDVDNGITSTKVYAQGWPFGGLLLTESIQGNGYVLRDTTNTLKVMCVVAAGDNCSTFPYLEQSVVKRRDWNGADLGTVTDVYEYGFAMPGSFYGDPMTTSTTVTAGDGNIVNISETWTTYKNDPSKWLISLPDRVTKVHHRKVAGVDNSASRSVGYEYDANGLLKIMTTDPASPYFDLGDQNRVTTEFIRSGNTFGLVNQKKQTWKDPYSGHMLTRIVSDTSYENKGRFPSTVKNALGQAITYGFDAGTGAGTSLKGPNGLSITSVPDGFGRTKTMSNDSDHTRVENYFKQCVGDCPGGARLVQITDAFTGNARSDVPKLVYADAQGRPLTTETWGFDGTRIRADKEYDSQGRLHEAFQPAYLNQVRNSASRFEYDALGRTTFVYGKDEAGQETVTRHEYDGLRTVQTNARQFTRTVMRDAVGQVTSVTDADGKTTSYGYDAFGNLVYTVDPLGNRTTMSYDRYGHKTDLRDPDLGWIHYDVDPLGRVWQEISPNQRALGRSTRSEYDLLDRLTGRFAIDLESHWIYDTAANGIGKLAEAYVGATRTAGYLRVNEYDGIGRPIKVTQTLSDGTYTQKTEYDDWNRVKAQEYQRNSDAVKRFEWRYNDRGYVERIVRGNLDLWKANKQDASGRLRESVLGNGLLETTQYNDFSGTLTSIQTSAAGLRRAEVSYEYDKLSNVKKRIQFWETAGFSEGFDYDALNRIKSSKLSTQTEEQKYTYNVDGGIASKAGVGYTYPVPGEGVLRPHAVTSIGGLGSFKYDDNGNMLDGAGRMATWTSFDMPKRISNAAGYSEFVYGPELQRVRQDRPNGDMTIYAGPQEVVKTSSGVTVKTYWPRGIGLEIDRPNTPTELLWSHVDHLGSTIALTDDKGAVKERMSYDVWGKWRRLDAAGLPISMGGISDNSGYTGHEMLEQLDLVHMNGRVYDPNTARFLSADPVVTDPFNGQSYNRYSYVLNNPFAYTDPSGYSETGFSCGNCNGGGGNNGGSSGFSIGFVGGSNTFNGSHHDVITPPAGFMWCGLGESCLMKKIPEVPVFTPTPSVAGRISPSGILATAPQNSAQSASNGGIFSSIGEWWRQQRAEEKASWEKYRSEGHDMADADNPVDLIPLLNFEAAGAKLFSRFEGGSIASWFSNVNPCRCFVQGTLVQTKEGAKPIEDVKVGELVAARNEATGETGWKPVVALIRNGEKAFIRLVYVDDQGNEETLVMTPEHPLMVVGNRWTQARDLRQGDRIVRLEGEPVTIQSVTLLSGTSATYNFEVADFHTYFVGAKGLWAHNACDLEKLTREARDLLRDNARTIWQQLTGRRALWDGLQIHHRVPLEYAHLFPGVDPNRVANLVGVDPATHTLITNAWNAWGRSLAGRIPTQAEVISQALVIDAQFSKFFRYVK